MADVLGTFEQAVLLALVRLGEGAYGRAILDEVQMRLKRDVAAGAIYSTLERLEAKALATSRLGAGAARPPRPPTPPRRGRSPARPGSACGPS